MSIGYWQVLFQTTHRFDSSYKRGSPATFKPASLMPGFQEAPRCDSIGKRCASARWQQKRARWKFVDPQAIWVRPCWCSGLSRRCWQKVLSCLNVCKCLQPNVLTQDEARRHLEDLDPQQVGSLKVVTSVVQHFFQLMFQCPAVHWSRTEKPNFPWNTVKPNCSWRCSKFKPPNLRIGYGSKGAGGLVPSCAASSAPETAFELHCSGAIPPDSGLFFELELLEVSPPAEGLAWLWEQAMANPMPSAT